MIGGSMLPHTLSYLEAPSPAAQAVSEALASEIRGSIAAGGGWISFARYMELALYAPGLGYYSAGSTKFGASGDFTTAPELSPLFARCLARQVAQLVDDGIEDVVELGAGSGALAAGILPALAALGALPERYLILEVSADLRDRQRALLAERATGLLDRVEWLDVLPAGLDATVIANEVLDAIPTHVVRTSNGNIQELGVALSDDGITFQRSFRPASAELLRAAQALGLPQNNYETEVNLAAPALVRTLARLLGRGALLLIDYGFPAGEYYHPQRSSGTLMCHYRHRGHGDPFALIGLQDITAHVDFTAIAAAGVAMGLRVLGYAAQAQFLVNLGITDMLSEIPAADVRVYGPIAAQAQRLLSPGDMGELFKVLALGRGVSQPLIGFERGDRAHTL
jgi:SAM-dependent MidA family methyltransferase